MRNVTHYILSRYKLSQTLAHFVLTFKTRYTTLDGTRVLIWYLQFSNREPTRHMFPVTQHSGAVCIA